MSERSRKGRLAKWCREIIGWTGVCLIIVLVWPMFLQSTLVWCRAEEVDIRSGELRYSQYHFWYPSSRRITSTPISLELGLSASPETADWQLVNTISPGTFSPHYAFHGAITHMKRLAMLWESCDFTPAARKESAARLLAAWQTGKNTHGGTEFFYALARVADEHSAEHPGIPFDVEEFPK